MKRLLMLAVLATAVSQVEAKQPMNTQGGIQKLIGQGGQRIKCSKNQQIYVGSNGKVRCIKKNSMGASKSTLGKVNKPSLVGPGGQRIDCAKNQYVYVGSHGAVSCINKGLVGATRRS